MKNTNVILPDDLFIEFKLLCSKRHKFKRGYTRIGFIEALCLYNVAMPLFDPFFREYFGEQEMVDETLVSEYSRVATEVVRLGIIEFKKKEEK